MPSILNKRHYSELKEILEQNKFLLFFTKGNIRCNELTKTRISLDAEAKGKIKLIKKKIAIKAIEEFKIFNENYLSILKSSLMDSVILVYSQENFFQNVKYISHFINAKSMNYAAGIANGELVEKEFFNKHKLLGNDNEVYAGVMYAIQGSLQRLYFFIDKAKEKK